MEKRLVLAIALSLLVMISWSAIMNKTQHAANNIVTNQAAIVSTPTSTQEISKTDSPKMAIISEQASQPSASTLTFKLPDGEVIFLDKTASISEVKFLGKKDYAFVLQNGLFLDEKNLNFKKEFADASSITFSASDGLRKVTKKYDFSKSLHNIVLQIKIQNLTNSPLSGNLILNLGNYDFSSENKFAMYQDAAVSTKDFVKHINPRKDLNYSNINYIAFRDRYFCAILQPKAAGYFGNTRKFNVHSAQVWVTSPDWTLKPGETLTQDFRIYLGPQDLRALNSIDSNWGSVINYGTFDFISQILLQLLEFIHKFVSNWGWTIVIFSIVIYLILYPLTLKQMRSMKDMQKLQPKIEALRITYKDNPQRLNKEIMGLYKEHKVNPLGGCLPLLLQMPIFFALYQVLMRSVALRGANFLWIKDLSEPDRLFMLPVSLPILGDAFNILPILMAIEMFVQQKFSMNTTVSSEAAQQQKIMMIIMPIMFGFIFYGMPSGLVLYWFINSSLMLVNQIRIAKAE